jgi:trigger factor
MTLTIPGQDVESFYKNQLQKLNKDVKIDGFRPGKIPLQVLEQRYGPDAFEEAVTDAVKVALHQAQKEKNLAPAGGARILKFQQKERGKDVVVDLQFETVPQVNLSNLTGLEFTKLTLEPTSEELQSSLEAFQEFTALKRAQSVSRPIQNGDLVHIESIVEIDGSSVSKQPRETSFIMGKDDPLFGQGQELLGLEVGATKTLKTVFPDTDDYTSLRNKPVTFNVTITEIKEIPAITLDDQFAKDLGESSLADFMQKYKASLIQENHERLWSHQKRLVLDALDKSYHFDTPPSMVENEFENIWHRFLHDYHAQHDHHSHDEHGKCQVALDPEEEKEIKATYRKIAERRVRLGVVLQCIAGEHLKDTKPELSFPQYLNTFARRLDESMHRQLAKELKRGSESTPMLDYIRSQYFEDMVIQYLLKSEKVLEKALSIKELSQQIEASVSEISG